MKQGIYTLANDVVLQQTIALLNSIEVNGNNIPVCIIPMTIDAIGLTKKLQTGGIPTLQFSVTKQ